MQTETHGKKKWTKDSFIQAWVKGELGKFKRTEGNYHALVGSDGSGRLEYTAHGEGGGTETVAVKLSTGLVISNANTLKFADTKMAWGRRTGNWGGQSKIQQRLERLGATPLPFSVFTALQLSIAYAVIIEKQEAGEVTLTIPKGVWNQELNHSNGGKAKRHFVGAALLRVGDSYFLFDIDQEEIKHGRFNPFVVKLPKPVNTIAEAYDSLIPDLVRLVTEQGFPVERQGEWFFIKRYDELPKDRPTPSPELIERACKAPHVLQYAGVPDGNYIAGDNSYRSYFADENDKARYEKAVDEWEKANRGLTAFMPIKGELKTGENRPNTVEKFVTYQGMTLVSGDVEHTGREHRTLKLEGWWQAIPNTAIKSWQVSGDID